MLSIDFWSLTTNVLHFKFLEQNISALLLEFQFVDAHSNERGEPTASYRQTG